jgi:glutamate-1-semialdehyde aminotransferase
MIMLSRGRGGRCFDTEGKEFLDFQLAFGGVLLGHAYTSVNNAIIEQLQDGILLPGVHPLQEALCLRLTSLFPCSGRNPNLVILRKTGSEAVAVAVRLARAYTKRDQVLRCGYHGWLDWCSDGVFPRSYGDPVAAAVTKIKGIPKSITALTTRFDANDLNAVDRLLSTKKGQVACLVVAPEDVLPPLKNTLGELRKMADRSGALLIFDEIKTGFRAELGGIQRLTGIIPDLCAVGKGLANGLPLAATLGREDIMSLAPSLFLSSTYSSELVSIAAAHATLDTILQKDVLGHLHLLGQRFIDGVNVATKELGIEDRVKALAWPVPSMPFIQFFCDEFDPSRFEQLIFQRNVLFYSDHMNFIAFSHNSADIARAVEVCAITLEEMIHESAST